MFRPQVRRIRAHAYMIKYGRIKGKTVKVTFFDHSIENPIDHEPMLCEAFGIVHSQSKLLLLLQTWRLVNADSETKEQNKEVFKILKSCIQDVKIYT